MKIGKLVLGAIAVLLIGGFAYLLIVDVPVKQTDVSREIPHDRFAQ
jgi:hypothetical protein